MPIAAGRPAPGQAALIGVLFAAACDLRDVALEQKLAAENIVDVKIYEDAENPDRLNFEGRQRERYCYGWDEHSETRVGCASTSSSSSSTICGGFDDAGAVAWRCRATPNPDDCYDSALETCQGASANGACVDAMENAWNLGSAKALGALGMMAIDGTRGASQDDVVARAALEAACGRGDTGACVSRGSIAPRCSAEASLWYEHAKRLGDPDGNNNLGATAQNCHGDRDVAMREFEVACDAGIPAACSNLGRLWLVEPAPDTRTALVYLIKACDLGYVSACSNAFEVEADVSTRQKLADQGCYLLDGEMCVAAGLLLVEGQPPDAIGARSRFQRACDAGSLAGCVNYGICLRDGFGGGSDLMGAQDAFKRACDFGSTAACAEIDGRPTPNEMASP